MNYTIKKIRSIDELMQFGSDGQWNALLAKSRTNRIYLTFEWAVNWWRCFGKGREMFILLVRDAKGLVAIAPLMITTSGFGIIKIRVVEFIGTPLSNYSDFIISKGCEDNGAVLRGIYDYLLKERDSWDIISLKEIPEVSSTLADSGKLLKKSNTPFTIFPDDICPALVFEELQKDEIEKKINKKDVRRRLKRLSKLGTVSYDHCRDTDDARVLMDTFFRYHIARWKSTNTPSMFEDERYREFYMGLMKSMMPKKQADISLLRLDGNPIAIQIGFIHDNNYDGYSTSYDLGYAKYSPGLALFRFNIENYYSLGYGEFDFGRGDEPYKFRFSSKLRKNYKMGIYKGHILFLIDTILNRLRIEIMKHDRLRYAMRGVKDKLTAVV